MNTGRTLKIDLGSTEIAILTEVMCAQGCSMETAARWLIARHGPKRRASNDYMREYMKDWRAAKKAGLEVMEYRKRNGKNVR